MSVLSLLVVKLTLLNITYDYDSRHILCEPMKHRKKESQTKATKAIFRQLAGCDLKSTFHVLDSEVSEDLITYLEDEKQPCNKHLQSVTDATWQKVTSANTTIVLLRGYAW